MTRTVQILGRVSTRGRALAASHPQSAAPLVPPAPVPREMWPAWAEAIAACSRPEDVGVGDTARRAADLVAAVMGRFGMTFRKHCGCERRRIEWNARYPYIERG